MRSTRQRMSRASVAGPRARRQEAIEQPKPLPEGDPRRHIARVRCHLLLICCATLGCSSGPLVLPKRPVIYVDGTLVVPSRPAATLYREEVVAAVQAGLGHFLQRVDVRAVTHQDDAGRRVFVGFEVLSLRPALEWLTFDFAPGDIVTKIDGVSVEHYNSVIPLFERLVAKDQFEVSLIRSGQPKTVVINIRERQALPRAH